MKERVADIISNIFVENGVSKVFLLSGGGMMHLLDGIASNSSLDLIFHHHEQSAGMAAEGYSRVADSIGVCYGTSGPGAVNLVTAIAGAWLDSSPTVFITGQSKVEQTIRGSRLDDLRQFGTFEVDTIDVVKSITKYTYFLDDPTQVQYVMEKAIHIARSGRPGPVLIDIPIDVQGAMVDRSLCKKYSSVKTSISPDRKDIEMMLSKWSSAKRPVIVAGHGIRVSKTVEALEELAEKTNTPVVTTQLGKDILEYDHPLFVGHPGLKGDRMGNIYLQNADFIVFLGSSVHVLNTGYELDKFATEAYKVQVDIDKANFEREDVGIKSKIHADLGSFFDVVNNNLKKYTFADRKENKWLNNIGALKEKYSVYNENHKVEEGCLNIYKALEVIDKSTKGEEIIVTDAGSAFYVVGQAWHVKKGQRIITSGGLGSMGWALPAASGAAFSSDKTVICITGDGSLQTNIHALSVLAGYGLNVKVFVLNNSGYISIINTQNNYFNGNLAGVNKDSGVHLPDLSKIADTYELGYVSASSEEELRSECAKVLSDKKPYLIDISCNLLQDIIPTVSSKKLDTGKMVSLPIDEMFPFLDEKECAQIKGIIR